MPEVRQGHSRERGGGAGGRGDDKTARYVHRRDDITGYGARRDETTRQVPRRDGNARDGAS